jgi:lysophospholipase L1-like esterase
LLRSAATHYDAGVRIACTPEDFMIAFVALSLSQPPAAPAPKWEKEIAAIERRIAAEKPAPGGTVFYGSSTIRLWDVRQSFPELKTFNAGFGGSNYRDAVEFVDRAVAPLAPQTVVLYSGDNDVAQNRDPTEILDDFKKLVDKLRAKFPSVRLVVLGIKPSPKRWSMWSKMRETNRLVEATCRKLERASFVDLAPFVLKGRETPDPKYFKDDQLHLNSAGYAEVAKLLAEKLK